MGLKIDVFPHIFPKPVFDRIGELTPAFTNGPIVDGREAIFDLDARFRMMDRYEDYVQVLTLAAPPIEDFAEGQASTDLATLANDSMAELVQLRGVGRKTANVVLGVGFGIPGFPVDTHVGRLVRRLRLTTATDPVKVETDICRLVPAEEWTNLSLRLILHGRQVCVSQRPRCPRCVLADICPSSYLGLKPVAHRAARAAPRTAGA